nr:MAG TPA: hypothetical protein [Caudoviricetes sp.]
MAKLKDFIGIIALQEVANQVFASVVQGPAFANPEEMKRLGIKTISGVQYKRTMNVFVRKGGTTRRKDMNPTMNGTIGFLKERVLTAKLAWFKGTDNIDHYCETVFGVDAQGAYPLSTVAVEAVIKTHADDLYNNLWWGDIDNDVPGASEEKKAMGLYDGFITCIKHDIEDGVISEANHNLIHCEAISAPADATDSSAYKNFRDAYMSLDPRLRRQKVYAYMTPETAINIADGYALQSYGTHKLDVVDGGNYVIPELPKLTIAPVEGMGVGDRIIFSVEGNLIYAVDTESNQTFVEVALGSDNDLRDIVFQCQSIQGAMVASTLSHSFAVTDGPLQSTDFQSGDYTNSNLVVTLAHSDSDTGKIDAKVKVDGVEYKTPIETTPNQIISLVAEDSATYKFVSWSNGKTDKTIQLTASGMNMGLTAFFKKNG